MSDIDKTTCPVCFTKMRKIKKVLTCPECGYKYCDHSRDLQNMFDTNHAHEPNYTTYTQDTTSYSNASSNTQNYRNTYSSSGKTTYTNTNSGTTTYSNTGSSNRNTNKKNVGKIVKIIVIIYMLLMFCPMGCGLLFTAIGVIGEMADEDTSPEIHISTDLSDEDSSINDLWEDMDAQAPVSVEGGDGDFIPELIMHIFDADSLDEVTNEDISTVYSLEIRPDSDNNLYVYYYTTDNEYGSFTYEGDATAFNPKDLEAFFALQNLYTPYTRYKEGDLENLECLTTLYCENSPAELVNVLDPTQIDDLTLIIPSDVATLDGLEEFTELLFLEIDTSYTYMTDVSQIAELTDLYYLSYTNYDLDADYSFLEELPELECLYLCAPGLSDLSFVENMPNLRILDLELNTQITDLSPLTDAADSLTSLSLMDCYEISNFSPLSELSNLEYLGLDACLVDDLSFVSDLDNLRTISISDTSVTSLEPLKDLPNLEYIYAYGVAIDDYAGLKDIVFGY